MRRLAALGASLLLWSVASPALAFFSAIGIGNHNQAAALTNVVPTTADCPPGSTIMVSASFLTVADPLTGVVDSAGNTYQTPIDNISGTGVGIGTAYAYNTLNDLPSAGTITATLGGSVTSTVGALCLRGASSSDPLDTHANSAVGLAAMASTTVNTGTLALPREFVVGVLGTPASMGGGPPCNGNYARSVSSPTSAPALIMCQQTPTTGTASVAFSPTWTNANNYAVDLMSFKGPPATLGSTGVGY